MAEAPAPAPAPIPVPTTYRERLAQFRILEEKRHELIEVRPSIAHFAALYRSFEAPEPG